MEIQVGTLREALNLIKPVILRKPTLEVVKNVLLDEGRVIGSDLTQMVAVDLPEADRRCLLPHSQVLDLLSNVPGSKTITVEQKEKKVKLDWGIGEAEFDVQYVDEYPDMPKFNATVEGSVDGDALIKALVSVVPFCSNEDSRVALTGVAMHIKEDEVVVVGADGFRLGYLKLPIVLPAQETVIIPVPSIKTLQSLWKVSAGVPTGGDTLISHIIGKRLLYLSLNSGYLSTRFGKILMVSKLIEGSPPDYATVLPKEEDMSLTVRFYSTDLDRALQGAKQVSRDNGNIIRLEWDENTLTVAARCQETGQIKAKVPIETEGGGGRIGMNIAYLLNYLKDKDGFVTMKAQNESSPLQFSYGQTPIVVMMPMFVKWDGDETESVKDETIDGENESTSEEDEVENLTGEDDNQEGEAQVAVGEAGGKKKGRKKKG